MNGRQERERQKTQLLRQIQQQRLELSACRRHRHEATAPSTAAGAYAAELRSGLMVARSDGRMVRTTSGIFIRAGPNADSTVEHRAWCADPRPVGSLANGPSVGAFLGVTLCHFLSLTARCSQQHAPFPRALLYDALLPYAITSGGGSSRHGTLRLRVLIAQKL